MRLESIHIKNFRAIKDQVVNLSDYTCFVGPNGAGKSTVLIALCVLFRYTTDSTTNLLVLAKEDFHNNNTDDNVEITATFTDLSQEAQEKLAHYYRQGKLIVSAIAKWDRSTNSAPVIQYGKREVMAAFKPFFRAYDSGASSTELRELYATCKSAVSALPNEKTKDGMRGALRAYEEVHPQECIVENSDAEFYGGAGKAQNLLSHFIQWVYVPAVKDASAEQVESRKTALGQILDRTVRLKMELSSPLDGLRKKAHESYCELLKAHERELEALGVSLTTRMREWAHPDARIKLTWRDDKSQVSIAEPMARVRAAEGATFEGDLTRFGHGFQRSFLLVLLQELAASGLSTGPKLILACEEPELYQHPPQVRHLASTFDALSQRGTQVLVCTHNPLFVRGDNFEEIRLVVKDRDSGEAEVRHLSFGEVADRIERAGGQRPAKSAGTALRVSQALKPNINEMFFTSVLVLVEGLEDSAYISTQMVLRNSWTDFRRYGAHIVICDGKSKIAMPLAIARGLKIPTFVVFDADISHQNNDSTKVGHARDNKMLMELCGHSNNPIWPTDTIWESNMVVWSENITKAISGEFGDWHQLCDASKQKHGVHDLADIFKCESYIQSLMSDLWDQGKVSQNLEKLTERLIAFAKQNGTGSVVTFTSATSQAAPVAASSDSEGPGKTEAA